MSSVAVGFGRILVGSLALGEPLTAKLLGLAVLGEHPDATTLTGAALLLGGIVLLSRPANAPRIAAAPDPGCT